MEAKQREMFMKVFGEKDFQAAWNNIMDNSTAKAQFGAMFKGANTNYADSASRGDGLPPPPPLVREKYTGAQQQRLFTDLFGQGEGLAMEMMIFGNRTKRDLFTRSFSEFLKENMLRDVQDKRDSWEDDMMQLMTDALGEDGPAMLREILGDPQRATLFRQAFAGYLEETASSDASLVQIAEGSTSAVEGKRIIPEPV